MAFICGSDSGSALRKQFHPKDGIMGTAILRGFHSSATFLARFSAQRCHDCLTVHAQIVVQLKKGGIARISAHTWKNK